MNKKFFTLIASVLMLAGFVGTASGQTPIVIPKGTVPAALESGKKYQAALTTKGFLEAYGLSSTSVPYTTYSAWVQSTARSVSDATRIFDDLTAQAAVTMPNPITGANVTARPLWYGYIDVNGNLKGDGWDNFNGNYYESIFCLKISKEAEGGQRSTLDLFHYVHGFQFLVDQADATTNEVTAPNTAGVWPTYPTLNAGKGTLGFWGYSNAYGSTTGNQHWMPLYVYKPGSQETVYILISDNTAPNFLRLLEWPISRVQVGDVPSSTVLFEFIEPAPRVLTAADFNTRLGTDLKANAQKLVFWGDKKGTPNATGVNFIPSFAPSSDPANFHPEDNELYAPWKNVALHAIDVKFQTTNNTNTGPYPNSYERLRDEGLNTGPWLYFQAYDGNQQGKRESFLLIDTNYYDANNKDLKFAWGDTLDGYAQMTRWTRDIDAATGSTGPLNIGNATNPVWRVDTTDLWRGTPRYVSDFINQYRFQLTYFWSNDSLAIDLGQVTHKTNPATPSSYSVATYWRPPYYEWTNINGRYVWDWALAGGANWRTGKGVFANDQAANSTSRTDWTANFPAGNPYNQNGDALHVKLTALGTSESKVLTVGERPIATRIKFGIPECESTSATIAEGVYIIRNVERDMLLTVPITSDTTAHWVNDRTTVDPQRIPAFQWIVKKTNLGDPDHSPVTLINREFPKVRINGLRLPEKANETITLPGLSLEKIDNTAGTSKNVTFQLVPAKILEDEYLGYYHAPDGYEERFDLNYYNWQQDEQQVYFLNKETGKDTTLLVNKVRSLQFSFVPQSGDRYYGYAVDTKKEDTKKVGVQLKRVAYQLLTDVVENDRIVQKMLVVNNKHRYALDYAKRNVADSAIFLLKTNNTALNFDKNTADFYALLDTTSQSQYYTPRYVNPVYGNAGPNDGTTGGKLDGTTAEKNILANGRINYDLRYVKLTIPDDVPWAYEETQDNIGRTSAFAVTRYTAPLYRRFDKGAYVYNNQSNPNLTINEEFAGDDPTDKDSPLYLKFHRLPQDWVYLYENSDKDNKFRSGLNNKSISFLGLQDAIHFTEGAEDYHKPYYEFYVDTAFVARAQNGTKPSETKDYTPMPQYMLALRPDVLKPGELSYQDGSQFWGPGEAPTPDQWPDGEYGQVVTLKVSGMTVGNYLFNAQDSVNVGNFDYRGKVADNIENDTRLAFVKGAHMGDTFYVLTGTKYEKYTAKQIQVLQGLDNILYNLPWFNKHYLGANTHFVSRYDTYPPTGYSTLEQLYKTRADSIAKYKRSYGKLPSYLANGKSMVFQFRLKNVAGVANPTRVFYIETTRGDREIGPQRAQFINDHNGAPIISEYVTFTDADWNDAAMGMQVKQADDYGKATANEAATVEGAKVISGTGSVTILNAAGKTVTVTNVLGQVVAKQVVTSDNATIALPKGIVVVSVDGTSSKALVK